MTIAGTNGSNRLSEGGKDNERRAKGRGMRVVKDRGEQEGERGKRGAGRGGKEKKRGRWGKERG